jgi:low temperature requirement protein LtrA
VWTAAVTSHNDVAVEAARRSVFLPPRLRSEHGIEEGRKLTWLGHTTFSTRFDTDDLIQRALTGLQMFLVAVMAINATGALDSRDSAEFAAAYSVMRFILVGQYLRVRHVRQARALTTRYAAGGGTAALMWLVSAVVPAPGRFAIWALALRPPHR